MNWSGSNGAIGVRREWSGTALGVDIGGTTTRLGLVSDGCVRDAITIPTLASEGPRALVARVASCAARWDTTTPTVSGVGVPGLLIEGRVHKARHFPGWDGVPLADMMEDSLGYPAQLLNDTDAAALGEVASGDHGTRGRLLVITLGTGVGISLVHDGFVLGGAGGRMPLCPPGGDVPVPILEDRLSATAVLRRAAELDRFADTPPQRCEELLTPDALGDPAVRDLWNQAGEALGWVCAAVGQLFMVERIVLNGGLARAGAPLILPAERFFQSNAAFLAQSCELVVSRLSADAAVLGAAAAALTTYGASAA